MKLEHDHCWPGPASAAVPDLGRSAYNMKIACLLVSLFLLILLPIDTHARAVESLDMKKLMERSQLVFVGQVKSVNPSGITTELTYPTWQGVVFEWLKVEVEVIEPIKGTKKGDIVHTMLLSARDHVPMINAPGMIEPKDRQNLLLCLLPTSLAGAYASVTAPFDDDEAIFPLEHKLWTNGTYYKDGKEVAFQEQSEKNRAIWDLTDDKGEINRKEAQYLRKKYAAEIAEQPSKDEIIYLKWKKETNENGWQRSVPDNGNDGAGKTKANHAYGPITHP